MKVIQDINLKKTLKGIPKPLLIVSYSPKLYVQDCQMTSSVCNLQHPMMPGRRCDLGDLCFQYAPRHTQRGCNIFCELIHFMATSWQSGPSKGRNPPSEKGTRPRTLMCRFVALKDSFIQQWSKKKTRIYVWPPPHHLRSMRCPAGRCHAFWKALWIWNSPWQPYCLCQV